MNTTPYRILAVCLGNICRSPLAEGLLQQEAQKRGLHWEVDSAGTSGWHNGELADPRSRAIALKHGLNINDQRSRKVVVNDFKDYDLILAMDRQNARDLFDLASTHKANTTNIKEILTYAGLAEEHGPDVFDPYHDDDGFEGIYQLLATAICRIADQYEALLLDK